MSDELQGTNQGRKWGRKGSSEPTFSPQVWEWYDTTPQYLATLALSWKQGSGVENIKEYCIREEDFLLLYRVDAQYQPTSVDMYPCHIRPYLPTRPIFTSEDKNHQA